MDSFWVRETKRNVLFLCTGNSARSILAESILNVRSDGRFAGYSAGSQPTGCVNLHALNLLQRRGHDIGDLRSKSWAEFSGPNAERMHWVFTVCDNAAGEACPVWNGAPHIVHWGLPDPAAVAGDEREVAAAFIATYTALERLIGLFLTIAKEADNDDELEARLIAASRS